ncbi:MAG: hypothetical protein ACHP7O_03810, partial [Burkholderiales bacterium]
SAAASAGLDASLLATVDTGAVRDFVLPGLPSDALFVAVLGADLDLFIEASFTGSTSVLLRSCVNSSTFVNVSVN